MKEINKIQLNTEEYIIEPPIANETIQGGILAKQKTNESVPVKIRDGKCFIPEYPNGDNKIDITQSAQNKDKVMVVNNSGELEATEYKASNDNTLFGHIDKQEIYTINDGFGGSFKNLIVNGKTIQKIETDVVPTPSRPVPINSRKTIITKVNPNIFDLEKESDTSNIPDTGTYRSIGQHQLKPNTKYVFSWSGATVPAKSTLSFQIQDNTGTVLVSPFTYFNISSDEKEETGKDAEFTTDSSGIIKFAYNCIVGTSSSLETYQQYWYTKILKDISLKEDVEYEPEYVELRSLKETDNLFDLKYGQLLFGEKVGSITNNGSGVIIENQYAITVNLAVVYLKANTNYCFKSNRAKEPIEGMEESGNDLNMLNVLKGNTPIIQVISGSTFTVNDNGYYYLRLYGTVGCKVSYTSIMLVEGTSAPPTYIPPTVRDYKIVDHHTQTAKIIRNVNQFELPIDFNWNYTDYYPTIIGNVIPEDKKGVYDTRNYNLVNYATEQYFGWSNKSGTYLGFSECNTYWELNNSDEVNAFLTRIKENGKPFLFQYQLAAPVEETITYVETDVSEVGYSWQDTASPSPDIPSDIESVNSIDVTVCGKNLFDINKVETFNQGYDANVINNDDGSITVNTSSSSSGVVYNKKLSELANLKNGETYTLTADTTGNEKKIYLYEAKLIWDFSTSKIITQEMLDSRVTFHASGRSTSAIIANIQIEQGSTATEYEPYKEQYVNITPPQPLYENDIANVESGDYEYEKQKYVVTGNETFLNDYQTQSGFYGRYFNLKNGNGILTEKIWCNYLSYIQESWSLASEGCCQNARSQIHLKFSNDRLGIADNTPLEEKRLAFANYLKQLYASGNPLYVVVKVTKTTQPIAQEDLTKLKSLKTGQGVTNISSNVPLTFDYEQSVKIVIDNIKKQINSTNANILIGG